jgi:hypothetical protein
MFTYLWILLPLHPPPFINCEVRNDAALRVLSPPKTNNNLAMWNVKIVVSPPPPTKLKNSAPAPARGKIKGNKSKKKTFITTFCITRKPTLTAKLLGDWITWHAATTHNRIVKTFDKPYVMNRVAEHPYRTN